MRYRCQGVCLAERVTNKHAANSMAIVMVAVLVAYLMDGVQASLRGHYR